MTDFEIWLIKTSNGLDISSKQFAGITYDEVNAAIDNLGAAGLLEVYVEGSHRSYNLTENGRKYAADAGWV